MLFLCRDANYVHIQTGNHIEAHWSNEKSTNTNVYNLTVDHVVELFNFLIDNIYIQVGSVVFQQAIGIPMGTGSFSVFF